MLVSVGAGDHRRACWRDCRSGLFGEESPGAWLPAAPTRALLRSYQEARSQDLARTLYIDWFDLHAARDAAEVAARRPRLD
jgi:hypothetical protein